MIRELEDRIETLERRIAKTERMMNVLTQAHGELLPRFLAVADSGTAPD